MREKTEKVEKLVAKLFSKKNVKIKEIARGKKVFWIFEFDDGYSSEFVYNVYFQMFILYCTDIADIAFLDSTMVGELKIETNQYWKIFGLKSGDRVKINFKCGNDVDLEFKF